MSKTRSTSFRDEEGLHVKENLKFRLSIVSAESKGIVVTTTIEPNFISKLGLTDQTAEAALFSALSTFFRNMLEETGIEIQQDESKLLPIIHKEPSPYDN